MTRKPAKPARRPRGGSRPRVGAVAATARVEIVLPPEVKASWEAFAGSRGVSVSQLIRVAVDAYVAGEGAVMALAALGSDVLDAVDEYRDRLGR